jgi:hypothetical protein
MKLAKLLLEVFQMFKVQIILKMKADENSVEIYNQIRAIEGVVVLTLLPSDILHAKSNDIHHYVLVRIKFIGAGGAKEALNQIKSIAIQQKKIEGLLAMIVRANTLKKIRNY